LCGSKTPPWRELEILEGGRLKTQEIPEGGGWMINLVFRGTLLQYGFDYIVDLAVQKSFLICIYYVELSHEIIVA